MLKLWTDHHMRPGSVLLNDFTLQGELFHQVIDGCDNLLQSKVSCLFLHLFKWTGGHRIVKCHYLRTLLRISSLMCKVAMQRVSAGSSSPVLMNTIAYQALDRA